MLKLYNTLTRKIEDFQPINPPTVGYYSCGPTVYDFAHIGHGRTYVFADILQRVLEFDGFPVKRVMNITDVGHLTSDSDTGEDKMEKGAAREKKTVWDIAEFYTDDFLQMLGKLNVRRPEIICKATDNIKEMIEMIKTLAEKGFTYQTDDGIYFDTSKFPEYGKLTGQSFDKLQKTLKAGARVELVSGKKNVTDFALWKLTPGNVKRQMEWDSPWAPPGRGKGKGFPGWHIECSAMSMKYLGETFDIHTGGVDHVPIHHTNEIAQSEAATGKPFVKYWLHADHLLVDNEKMSKSLGNFYRIADIEKKGFSPLTLRYLFLTASYRSQMNFTWKSLEAAKTAYESLANQILNVKSQIAEKVSIAEEKREAVNTFRQKFADAVNDDLNTAVGLAVVWEVLKSAIPPADKYDLLIQFDEILGLGLNQITDNKEQITISEEIKKLAEKREQLRKEKKWNESDEVRKTIEKKGFKVEDTPSGSLLNKK